jgi:alkylhydroperoxidase family enzyme
MGVVVGHAVYTVRIVDGLTVDAGRQGLRYVRLACRTLQFVPRIDPVEPEGATPEQRAAHEEGVRRYGRMTNMKRTLLHSLPAYEALMTWYPLREAVVPFLGERATDIFTYAISAETDCLICSTYFRRHLVDAGEDPDKLVLDEREQLVADFGRALVKDNAFVPGELYERIAAEFSREEIVALTAFGAMMIATNVFNNALDVELDEYLEAYRGKAAERG